MDLLYDPQTSGGLLISLPADQAGALLAALRTDGLADASIVGEVVEEPRGRIQIR